MRSSVAGGEANVRSGAHQFGELRPAHVHEGRVVAAFEIDVGLVADARLDDGVEPISLADRRDRTPRTIAEQSLKLGFAGQGEVLAELRLSPARLIRRDAGSTASTYRSPAWTTTPLATRSAGT